MESVIKADMLACLLEEDFINKQQHGFISKRSACSQLFMFAHYHLSKISEYQR